MNLPIESNEPLTTAVDRSYDPRRSLARAISERRAELGQNVAIALFAVPSALSLIAIICVDILDQPLLALLLTLLVFGVSAGWVLWDFRRREPPKVSVSASDQFVARVLVHTPSGQVLDSASWASSTPCKLLAAVDGVEHLVLLTSRVTEPNAEAIQNLAKSDWPAVRVEKAELNASASSYAGLVLEMVGVLTGLIDRHGADDVIVDVTGGTKIHTLAGWEVARSLDLMSVYVASVGGTPVAPNRAQSEVLELVPVNFGQAPSASELAALGGADGA